LSSDNTDSLDNVLDEEQCSKYRLVRDSFLVGIAVGCIIVAYRYLSFRLGNEFVSLYKACDANWHLIPGVFIVLAALAWIVAKELKHESMISGSGIPVVKGTLHKHLAVKWGAVLFHKFVGGLICLAAGLSVGREGPSVQMGGCVGEGVAKTQKKSRSEVRYLISCGAAAGLSAAFSAPLAGVMFALEELHKNFSPLVLLSAMIASLSADFIAQQFFGLIPSLNLGEIHSLPLKYYWSLLLLGVSVGASGFVFNKGILLSQRLFRLVRLPLEIKILIPFLLTGVLGLFSPLLLGGGYDLIMSLKTTHFTFAILLGFTVVKFLFTFVCFGSGVPGGIFFPLLALGALIGNIIGIALVVCLGIPDTYMVNFIILAMAGHFAAIVKAPITAVILVTEMTGSLEHLLALCLVVVVAQLISDMLRTRPIYDELLDSMLAVRNESNTTRRNRFVEQLRYNK